jgi:hypothetical protein
VLNNGLVTLPAGDRQEHWVHADLRPAALASVRTSFSSDTRGTGTGLALGLLDAGYRLPSGAGAPGAEGRAEILYCHDQDRDAATGLAIWATRWLTDVGNTPGITLAPHRSAECAGVDPGTLILALDFARAAPVAR